MEILYILVFVSLAFSFGFLVVFFWAVDSGQMESLDQISWSILDEEEVKIKNKEEEIK